MDKKHKSNERLIKQRVTVGLGLSLNILARISGPRRSRATDGGLKVSS